MSFKIEMSPEVSSLLISSAVTISGSILSYFSNKRQMKKEIEKMKLEWERDDKLRAEQARRNRGKEMDDAYSNLYSRIAEFRNKPNLDSKAAAEAAICELSTMETNRTAYYLDQLLAVVESSNGFEEPPQLAAILEQIRIERRKKACRQQASDTP